MKKFSFWIIISIFTFLIGLGAVLTLLYYNQKQIVEVEPVPLFDNSYLQSKSFPGLSKKISEITKGESGYFSKNTWKRFEISDASMNAWYGKYLKVMDEKSLLDISDNTEVYRFLWLRSFHHPIFVRIERKDNSIQLFSKELDGAGGYGSGNVIRKANTTLDENQWFEFLSLLEKSNFWKMPSEKEILVNDGANWILEGVKKGRYHLVDRNPPEDYYYQEACVYLLKLSGIDTDKLGDELY